MQVRALVTLLHNSTLYKPGDIFEYAGELLGHVEEGMEQVTKKTTAAWDKAKAEAHAELTAKAQSLRHIYDDIKSQLDADPSRGELIQLVLDAETAWHAAEADVAKASADLI